MRRLLALLIVLELAGAPTRAVEKPGPLPAAAPAYLLEENFETGSAPPGWTVAGVWTWDTKSPVLEGTGCAKAQDWMIAQIVKSFPAQGEVWAFALVQCADVAKGGAIHLRNASGTTQASVLLGTDGRLTVRFPNLASASTTGTRASDTTYSVWVHYKKGRGSNAVLEACFSADGTKPAEPGPNCVRCAGGDANDDVAQITLAGNNRNSPTYFDRVLVSTSKIGDKP